MHLISSHYVARALIGKALDKLHKDCRPLYRSPEDANPKHFQYRSWLYSFYTEDGRHIAALMHSEFDGFEIAGECDTPQQTSNCWWNTITFATSDDFGYSFVAPPPPTNLVAALPYAYSKDNRSGAYGYFQPTNIIRVGKFYYALINNWPHLKQRYGACLIRTDDVFNPRGWLGWNGSKFSVKFVNPYGSAPYREADRVCEPVLPGVAESFVELPNERVFIVSVITPDNRFGIPGIYLMGSRDMIHWSTPALVESVQNLEVRDRPGSWNYGYSSLIDASTVDQNFSTSSLEPDIYYVRIDRRNGSQNRDLVRQRLKIAIDPKS